MTSACAVGSHAEIGWLKARATISSSMTSTAPIGTSPVASASCACSSAASMKSSADIGATYHSEQLRAASRDLELGAWDFLPAEDDPEVARTCGCNARLLVLARPLLAAKRGADNAPKVRRHHFNQPALILGERVRRGCVGGEDADDAIAVHERRAERASEPRATIE